MGEDNKANMLREFVDTELVPGRLDFGVHFDDAFNEWKLSKLKVDVGILADNFGIYRELLLKSIDSFTTSKPTIIPYIDEITKSVDYENKW